MVPTILVHCNKELVNQLHKGRLFEGPIGVNNDRHDHRIENHNAGRGGNAL
jgi:hypothetical protein